MLERILCCITVKLRLWNIIYSISFKFPQRWFSFMCSRLLQTSSVFKYQINILDVFREINWSHQGVTFWGWKETFAPVDIDYLVNWIDTMFTLLRGQFKCFRQYSKYKNTLFCLFICKHWPHTHFLLSKIVSGYCSTTCLTKTYPWF